MISRKSSKNLVNSHISLHLGTILLQWIIAYNTKLAWFHYTMFVQAKWLLSNGYTLVLCWNIVATAE